MWVHSDVLPKRRLGGRSIGRMADRTPSHSHVIPRLRVATQNFAGSAYTKFRDGHVKFGSRQFLRPHELFWAYVKTLGYVCGVTQATSNSTYAGYQMGGRGGSGRSQATGGGQTRRIGASEGPRKHGSGKSGSAQQFKLSLPPAKPAAKA
jgi:hypothetical protein